ncbi:hypothetical protein NVP1152O_028 [Vibrio phage 1.152.O._10N.222.46.E1]|uniref:Uncharacterized protein n=5 Tax=Nahantvirus 49C7 TaxID=2846601 RepID=A0A2I7RBA9_9CAUD|nr:hypothetical protein HYP57_gp027 [Vibrio phage 1.026.O._10N.222.49.C7]AUR82510.1 hypothetical protein NVP1025O_027 [Vibrio phage 1.025.O._10N.222.46.B6]AUR90760.1 hypothetical protein NVP1150O_027 [Vibrio phage 1.150.O._10N.222.46.A6]AUR90933.1 hypothetical protein NVP1152O_028 [Vibrio phage 1.152.O._10N.222.46.E1]AUS02401.1 hypothetical protein NVP2130O_027 [Vibrio phage 2.130.O._10N.222.46.C2]AUR82618.1 hypothetical protein NVP1026O_027 [Vibrio phage 1.026.O._10N.222.49.C7]
MLEIIKSLKIKVTQADVEQALIELIAKQDPTIIVDSIEFAAKRSGKDSIAVSVEAHFGEIGEKAAVAAPDTGGYVSEASGEDSNDVPVSEEEEQISGTVTDEDEAPFETEAEVTAKTSLFG